MTSNTNRSRTLKMDQLQVAELQKRLEQTEEANSQYAREAALADERVQNTLGKLEKVEKDGEHGVSTLLAQIAGRDEQIATLQAQLAGKNQILLRAQASHNLGQAPTSREKQSKTTIKNLQEELAKVKTLNERLVRQMEVEKRDNNSRGSFMRSDPHKGYDEDDEEELPG